MSPILIQPIYTARTTTVEIDADLGRRLGETLHELAESRDDGLRARRLYNSIRFLADCLQQKLEIKWKPEDDL